MNNLKPISDDKQDKRGWQLEVNGEGINIVHSMTLSNGHHGTLEYGETPQGHDNWCFEEVSGGSVIVPYFISDSPPMGLNRLYIGLVKQDRYTTGGKVWNLPRGFMVKGETHLETAVREAGEELHFNPADRFSELRGHSANWNSSFSVTNESKQGVCFYSLEVRSIELKKDPMFACSYVFRKDVLKPASEAGELIDDCRFATYEYALTRSDIFTLAGVGRLLPTVMSQLYR